MGKAAISILLMFSCLTFGQEAGEVLPAAIGEWQAAGDTQVYVGDDLFMYIDGGAEVHHEYGFDRVFVRDYQRGEDIIAVELYRMTSCGFGLFSFTRSSDDEPKNLGNAGALSDYYLAFWSGNDVVIITAQTEFEGTKRAVMDIATELAERFPASGDYPEMIAFLPLAGRVPESEKYITGPVVMQNVAYPVARFIPGYEEAVAADYIFDGSEGKLLVLRWSDAGAAAEALETAAGRAMEAGFAIRRADDGDMMINMNDGKYMDIRLDVKTAWIAIGEGGVVEKIIGLRTTGNGGTQ
ncbi:MAG TPA: DUF6599 family protein [Acidobacteriota bacterium]|nr:DUF6599 family protein [Acidobacteriota bacterium]